MTFKTDKLARLFLIALFSNIQALSALKLTEC